MEKRITGARYKGEWLTNVPRTYKSWHPRRELKLVDGPPKVVSENFDLDYLTSRKIVGVYLDEDVPEGIENRPWTTK